VEAAGHLVADQEEAGRAAAAQAVGHPVADPPLGPARSAVVGPPAEEEEEVAAGHPAEAAAGAGKQILDTRRHPIEANRRRGDSRSTAQLVHNILCAKLNQ